MTNAPVNLQDLRRKIYVKAKAEPSWRFWGLYVHVCKLETLHEAYELASANNGAPGADGVTFAKIEDGVGVARFLRQIRDELVARTYRPMRNRRKEIPKEGGKVRVLSIPSIRDRVVQGALKLILEPIFEADFQPGSYGYRPRRSAHDAVSHVAREITYGKTLVIDLDLRSYFDNVRHHLLLEKVARRVLDDDVMRLLKLILKATGKKGVPQGGVISPLLSNLYLNEVDRMLERAVRVTQDSYTYVAYARFADDLVVLVDGHHRHAWLMRAVVKRLREELGRLQVEVNEDKTQMVNLTLGESFGFLGFDFRRVRSLRGKWRAQFAPRLSKRTALLRKLRTEFRRYRSRSTGDLIHRINSILRGWTNYFRVGHSGRCFNYVRDWVEKKVRRHLMRARNREGFGWKRWSSEWIHAELGLFSDYGIRYRNPVTKALPNR
ncbi:MAG: group II intron reverse transcriptase/maturase [bacterium]|nr:group II intron reverse transcriptase/maturase [bacterium]